MDNQYSILDTYDVRVSSVSGSSPYRSRINLGEKGDFTRYSSQVPQLTNGTMTSLMRGDQLFSH